MFAEKVHAMFRHGEATTRMKDFHDVALLARKVPSSGRQLSGAVTETFAAWGAELVPSTLAVLDPAWAASHERDWKRFLSGKALTEDMPNLAGVAGEIAALATPVLSAVAAGATSRATGNPAAVGRPRLRSSPPERTHVKLAGQHGRPCCPAFRSWGPRRRFPTTSAWTFRHPILPGSPRVRQSLAQGLRSPSGRPGR